MLQTKLLLRSDNGGYMWILWTGNNPAGHVVDATAASIGQQGSLVVLSVLTVGLSSGHHDVANMQLCKRVQRCARMHALPLRPASIPPPILSALVPSLYGGGDYFFHLWYHASLWAVFFMPPVLHAGCGVLVECLICSHGRVHRGRCALVVSSLCL